MAKEIKLTIILVLMVLVMMGVVSKVKEINKQLDNIEDTIKTFALTMGFDNLGVVLVTMYNNCPKQTDSSPNYTANGTRVYEGLVAVSQDFLKKGILKYGDKIYIEGIGFGDVHDCMNARYSKRIDIFTFDRQVARKFGVKKKRLYLVKEY